MKFMRVYGGIDFWEIFGIIIDNESDKSFRA